MFILFFGNAKISKKNNLRMRYLLSSPYWERRFIIFFRPNRIVPTGSRTIDFRMNDSGCLRRSDYSQMTHFCCCAWNLTNYRRTFVLSMIHSVFMLFGLFPVSSGSMPPWLVGVLTIASAVFAMIGGIVAFNRNRMGSVYLMLGALLCIVSPSEFWIYGSLYLIATVLCFFLPRRSDFADDEDDYGEDEPDAPEEELIDPRELRRRRREQQARVASAPQDANDEF